MTQISLAAARVNAGLKQSDVAKAIGVTPKTIGSYEKGNTAVPGHIFVRLSQLYKVPTDYIRLPLVDDGENDEEI